MIIIFLLFFFDIINYYEIPIYHFLFRIAIAHGSASCVEPDKENSYNVNMVLQCE